MKLEDVWLATNLANARERLLHLRDGCKLSGQLKSATVHDTLDPTVVMLLDPIVKAELTRRIAIVDVDLAAIGVTVQGDPPD